MLDGYKKAIISNKRVLVKKTLKNSDSWKFSDVVLGSDSAPEKKLSPSAC